MPGKIFCNFENEAFASDQFVKGPRGITIHVLTKTEGHTLDGYPATFTATQSGGGWRIDEGTEIVVAEPVIEDMITERQLP